MRHKETKLKINRQNMIKHKNTKQAMRNRVQMKWYTMMRQGNKIRNEDTKRGESQIYKTRNKETK